MKIKLDGVWVCSICGGIWGNEGTCGECGAGPHMEDLPFSGDCLDLADPDDEERDAPA